ncbi:uncharacterized protein DUF3311 [Scopulibacillus darangshiensis]|uniref:Uncharacterized protein DUF3311 n=1 Tax=Scopulibacillus darangshiensis TaxID=442528 RepID=A0A4R2P6V6_9BACL|nr:DUF3311 domain-containing protein [Scopulibacillus darangshiensis]TCP30593.1 uncharacterized protein DUF3311 [Scopulibacillus darangshiensis]
MNRIFEVILFLIPFIAQLLLLPWVNKADPFVIGLPFFFFWWLLWLLATPFFTLAIYKLRKNRSTRKEQR